MSEEEKKRILTWDKVFPSPTRHRYELLTGTKSVMEGVKKLCDSGRAELSYNVMENLLGRQIPILLGHPDFYPASCRVFRAVDVTEYEPSGFYIAFLGSSALSGETEFSCIFFDDILIYARVCTLNEVYRVWESWERTRQQAVEEPLA